MTKANKPPDIVYHLSNKIDLIIKEYLTKETPDYQGLSLAILLTLNEPVYRARLLFRDYSDRQRQYVFNYDGKKISIEANFYLTEVLFRRLELANNRIDQPTNMHKLLETYCQLTQNPVWHSSVIERDKQAMPKIAGFFTPLMKKLTQQRIDLEKYGYGERSQRRRAEFGAYWFKVQDCAAEVAEELGLFDVFKAIPAPLDEKHEKPMLLLTVLENLNERYGLLRSCGLPPQQWFKNSISDDVLKQFKELHKHAKSLLKQIKLKNEAYRMTFETLKAEKNKFMGFTDFNEFLESPVSERLFFKQVLPTKNDNGEENKFLDNLTNDETDDNGIEECELLKLPKRHPEDFNVITEEIFCRVLRADALLIWGSKGLLKQADFWTKVKNHHDYENLSDEKIVAKLNQQLAFIFNKYIRD